MTAQSLEFNIVAREPIPAFAPITCFGYYADSRKPSKCYGKVIGISATNITIGNIISVISNGEITNNQWNWSANSIIFLNGQSLSHTPPTSGFSQILGKSKDSHTILVNLSEPILL